MSRGKENLKNFKKDFQKVLDKPSTMCYNTKCQDKQQQFSKKKKVEKIKKVLDKQN